LNLPLKHRIKNAAKPFIAQYRRAPWWVKAATWILIGLIVLPDPFDWIPGIAFLDEVLYASVLLHILHKYGALPDEDKRSPKDLVNDILGRKK